MNSDNQRQMRVQIQLPCESDPSDPFTFDPQRTIGIGFECIVSFDCKHEPTIIHQEITGLNQVGFVFSSEYKFKPSLENVRKYECHKEGCEQAIFYKFDIKYYIWLVVGVGFGIGSSTFAFGTAGYTFKSFNETGQYETICICCDG